MSREELSRCVSRINLHNLHVLRVTLQMSQKMADEIGVNNVVFGKRVISISQDRDICTVECADDTTYNAKHVITSISGARSKIR